LFDAISDAIPGAIVVERCASLSPGVIRLEEVSIHDPNGREIARAEAVEAEPDWAALVTGTIGFHRASAEAPLLRLVDDGQELAIVSAFVYPTEEPDEEDAEIEVVLESIEVERGTLTDLPSDLSLRSIAGRTSLAVREAVELDLARLETEVTQGSRTRVRLLDASGPLSFGEEMRLAVEATLEAEGEEAAVEARFEGKIERFSFEAAVRTLDGVLEVNAANAAGRLESRVHVVDLDLGKLPWVSKGVVRAELDVVAELSQLAPSLDAIERVKAEGHVGFTSLALAEMQAESLSVGGRIEGRLPMPKARVTVKANGVEIQGDTIESLRLKLRGSDGRYDVEGRAPLPNGWILGVDFRAHTAWPVVRLDGNASLSNAPFSPVVARFSRLVVEPEESVSVRSLSVNGEGVEVRARGRYGFDRRTDFSFDLRSLELASLQQAFDLEPQLAGTLRGAGNLRGTRDSPELDATFELEKGSIERVPIDSARARIRYVAERSAHADLQVDLQENGKAELRADVRLARAGGLPKAFQNANYDARLVVESLALDALTRLIDAVPSLDGTLSCEVTARGALDSPDIELAARGRALSAPSFAPADVSLSAT
jgi:autotransporter translocation and assembly factor TamB